MEDRKNRTKNESVDNGQQNKTPQSLKGSVSKGYILSEEDMSAEDCLEMLREIREVIGKWKGWVN